MVINLPVFKTAFVLIIASFGLVQANQVFARMQPENRVPENIAAGLILLKTNQPVKLEAPLQTPTANQEAAIRKMEKALLGNIYISQIAPADMPAVYETFVRNIKENSNTWTATDWQNAEHIMNKLHFRKKNVQEKISAADMRKITVLQGQYRALKTENQL